MEVISKSEDIEKMRLRISLFIPCLFVAALWLTFLFEYISNSDFGNYGILPRALSGLKGIIFSPLIHGSFSHLFSNSIPLIVLGGLLIYFYNTIAYRVFFLIWLIDGLGVWLFGRESFHIGASGLVYGMASFLFFSGVLRKNRKLLAIALAVVFIYGGLLWGMLPLVQGVSWEAHLSGFLSGIFFSLYFLRNGPLNDPVPEWMNEENTNDSDNDDSNLNNSINEDLKIVYRNSDDSESPK